MLIRFNFIKSPVIMHKIFHVINNYYYKCTLNNIIICVFNFNLQVQNKDGLPQYFCYECAGLLYKFHEFRDRCLNGQKVLRDMLVSGPVSISP